jgi:hypothetical protein
MVERKVRKHEIGEVIDISELKDVENIQFEIGDILVKGEKGFTRAKFKGMGGRNPATYITVGANGASGQFDYQCDGVSDQVEIQQAINAVNAAGGGVVQLSEGTFIIDGSITLASNVTLLGTSWKTVIKVKGGFNANLNIFNLAGQQNIGLENLWIDVNRRGQTSGNLITFWSDNTSENLVIKNCKITDYFIIFEANPGSRAVTNVKIDGCLIDHANQTSCQFVSSVGRNSWFQYPAVDNIEVIDSIFTGIGVLPSATCWWWGNQYYARSATIRVINTKFNIPLNVWVNNFIRLEGKVYISNSNIPMLITAGNGGMPLIIGCDLNYVQLGGSIISGCRIGNLMASMPWTYILDSSIQSIGDNINFSSVSYLICIGCRVGSSDGGMNTALQHCMFIGCKFEGIGCRMGSQGYPVYNPTKDIRFIGCTFDFRRPYTGDGGIWIRGGKRIRISNCTFVNCSPADIRMSAYDVIDDVVIENNDMIYTTDYDSNFTPTASIWMEKPSSYDITNVVIRNNRIKPKTGVPKIIDVGIDTQIIDDNTWNITQEFGGDIILTSPNGLRYKVSVQDDGTLITTPV